MNTKHIINQVRYLSPAEVKKHRQLLLNLARWICMYFGYKIVKNEPEYVKITGRIRYPVSPNLKISREWITNFRSKGIHYKYDNPEGYLKRKEGQRNEEEINQNLISENYA